MAARPISAAKLLLHCKLVATGGEAKRMIQQGGVRIDDEKIGDPNMEVDPRDGMVVQVGKRKFATLGLTVPIEPWCEEGGPRQSVRRNGWGLWHLYALDHRRDRVDVVDGVYAPALSG